MTFQCCDNIRSFNSKHEKNSYKIIEYLNTDDCSIYAMKFKPDNNILFRISTSGPCSVLDKNTFLNAYKKVLKDSSEINFFKGKFLIVECPSNLQVSQGAINELTKEITGNSFESEFDKIQDFDVVKIRF